MTYYHAQTLEALGKILVSEGYYQATEKLWKKHRTTECAVVTTYRDSVYSPKLNECRQVSGWMASPFGMPLNNVPDGKRGV